MQVLEGRTATDEWNMPPEGFMRQDDACCPKISVQLSTIIGYEAYEQSSPVAVSYTAVYLILFILQGHIMSHHHVLQHWEIECESSYCQH